MTRDDLVRALWHGRDPFAGVPRQLYAVDPQGWRSEHRFLTEALDARRQDDGRPALVVEIGAWKGMSALFMAEHLERAGIAGTVVCVDTWLGAVDHWADPALHDELCVEGGYPALYRKFLANVLARGLGHRIVPLPLDSTNAAALFALRGLEAGVIHLDAGHEEASVRADLEAWWPRLAPGGWLVADDYDPSGGRFPGVQRAVDGFASSRDLGGPRHHYGKCVLVKP